MIHDDEGCSDGAQLLQVDELGNEVGRLSASRRRGDFIGFGLGKSGHGSRSLWGGSVEAYTVQVWAQ